MNQSPGWWRMQKFYFHNWLNRTWRRKVKPALKRPICLVLGHKLYKDNSWTGSTERCSRYCSYYKVLSRSQVVKQ